MTLAAQPATVTTHLPKYLRKSRLPYETGEDLMIILHLILQYYSMYAHACDPFRELLSRAFPTR